ncbi:hypothetical protein GCM10027456_24630 [Kineosporia babensis]
MPNLGDFTPDIRTDIADDPDVFTFCGEEFELPATSGAGSFLQFAHKMKLAQEQAERGDAAEKRARTEEGRAAARAEKVQSDMNAMSAVYSLLEGVLGEGQMDRFTRAADRYGVPSEEIFSIVNRLEAAVAGRPTRRSSDSSAGPSTTGPGSTDAGSGRTAPGTELLTEPTDSFRPLTPAEQQRANLQKHLVATGQLASQI